ncbi:MAG: PAS domain S-box protein [bacterium]|nr:PAS domain S-box protein [bacterium]
MMERRRLLRSFAVLGASLAALCWLAALLFFGAEQAPARPVLVTVGCLSWIACLACGWRIAGELDERAESDERTSELRLLNEALRQSEARYVDLYDRAPDMYLSVDVETGRLVELNGTLVSTLGYSRHELLGRPISELYAESSRARARESLEDLKRTGAVAGVELQVLRKSGAPLDVSVNATAIRDENGRIVRTRTIWRDVTDRRSAERRLRESERRYRTLVEHAPEAIVVLDVDAGHFVDANQNATRLFKMDREGLLRRNPFELSPELQPNHRSSRQAAAGYIEEALTGGTPTFEWEHVDADGTSVPCEVRLVRLPAQDRRLVRGSLTDITERRRTRERRQRMMFELDHRVKNNLTLVTALLEHTLAGTSTMDEFSRAFAGRIQAMAKTHDALALTRWEGVELAQIAERVLAPYGLGRIGIDGADVTLSPSVVTPFGLVLHELATNAVKYGALATERGRIDVRWSLTPGDRIDLVWKESGAGEITPPTEYGRGIRLSVGLVEYEIGGSIELDFATGGLSCRMNLPAGLP